MSATSESKTPAKKTPVFKALPEIWQLIRPRRGLLALGLVLMVINRVSGLVLPYSTKFLVDNVITKRQMSLLPYIVGVVLSATLIQGLTSFTLDADAVEGGAEADCRAAAAGAGAHRAAVGLVLRLEQDGHHGVAHHERRGGRAQPGGHRAGGLHRRRC